MLITHNHPADEPQADSLAEGLLTPMDTAALLGVSVATLADWRCRGGGPRFTRAGRLIRYRPSALNTWLKEREASNNAERKYREAKQ